MAGTFPWRLDTVLVARAHERLFPKKKLVCPRHALTPIWPHFSPNEPNICSILPQIRADGRVSHLAHTRIFFPWEQNLKRAQFGAKTRARHFQIFWGGGSHKLRGSSTEG